MRLTEEETKQVVRVLLADRRRHARFARFACEALGVDPDVGEAGGFRPSPGRRSVTLDDLSGLVELARET